MNERQFLEKFRLTPEGQRLLQAIQFAEGTKRPGRDPYRVLFGGGTFADTSRHPDTVVQSGGYKSAAAGAYQFMPGTWQSYASRLGLKSFGPKEQDIAALALAREKLMDIGGLSVLKKEGLSPRVSAALSPAWASFPTLSGKSYYGQPVKSLESLQKVFGRQASVPAAPEEAPMSEAVATEAVSLPKFNFQEALKNIVSGFALQAAQPQATGDKALEYLQLANALEETDQEDLAADYRAKALAASAEPLASVSEPTQVIEKIVQAKMQEKLYNQQVKQLEDTLNKNVGAPTQQPSGQLTPSSGQPIKGVQITSAVDTSGEPGFDFVIPGGRGAEFKLPFKAQVLKVVNDPWETNLEKGPGRRGYGNFVDVRGIDPKTGKQFDVRLAHFDKLNPSLKPGAVINPGTFIGTQGRTGSTTGAHVSADFYDPDKNTASAEILKLRDQIRDRLAKGLPVL